MDSASSVTMTDLLTGVQAERSASQRLEAGEGLGGSCQNRMWVVGSVLGG